MINLESVQLLLCDFTTKTFWYSRWVYRTFFYKLEKCKVYLAASNNYWSSTPNADNSNNAWNINFNNGNENNNNKNNNNNVRCVRESKNV